MNADTTYTDSSVQCGSDLLLRHHRGGCDRERECELESDPGRGAHSVSLQTREGASPVARAFITNLAVNRQRPGVTIS